MQELVRATIKEALRALNFPQSEFTVEYAIHESHGDIATNVAMSIAKELGKSPCEVAKMLCDNIKELFGEKVQAVEVAGPGFINISFSTSFYGHVLEDALSKGSLWGSVTTCARKRVIIEYANPNPFKEMHIGHLMGAIIGESLARLFENAGATVARDTFGGDVGPHVAKALFGLTHENITVPENITQIGKAYVYGSLAYEDDPLARMSIDSLNVTLYGILKKHAQKIALTKDEQALYVLWEAGREISTKTFEQIYRILGIQFDHIFYDSDTTDRGLAMVTRGLKEGVFEKSDGAIVYRGEKKGLHTLVFVTSRGTPTYETKDLGLAVIKEKVFPSDQSIIITANEQIGHFKVMLSALSEIENALAKKTTHVPHGFMRLTTGKMSSRKGTVITATTLIDSVVAIAKKKNEDSSVAIKVAIGAIIYMILRQSPGADIIFDAEKSLSLEGDSGPYLQYALVRAFSVLRTAHEKRTNNKVTTPISHQQSQLPPHTHTLMRTLTQFPDIVAYSQEHLAPNFLVTYLTRLASQWNTFYANERIIDGEHEEYVLHVVTLFSQTMSNGMSLLGIPILEKM